MPTVELTDEQVVDLVKQLPPERRRAALLALASSTPERRAERLTEAAARLRQLCSERGLDWDKMTEDQREAFIDGLVHEDRPCGP